MRKISILGTLLTISIILMLFLTSCRKASEPIAGEEPKEESASLMVENSTKSVEVENGIEEKEEEEIAVEITEEEIINLIIEENQDMIKEFLMNPPVEVEQIWVQMSVFDFTGDGKKEIMLSKEYITNSRWGPISYNYVFDREGNKLFEFMGGATSSMFIYVDWEQMELYFYSDIYCAAVYDTFVYTKVVKHEDWEKEVNIGAWVRDIVWEITQLTPGDSNCIFRISLESEQNIFENAYDGMEIAREKEPRIEREELGEYLQSFEELEENKLDYRDVIIYIQDKFIMNPNEEGEIILWDIE